MTVYLIDTENVQDRFTQLIDSFHDGVTNE